MTTKPQSSTELELKPCPFCGAIPEITSDIRLCDQEWVWIDCPNCDSEGPTRAGINKAIKAWNTRVSANRVAPTVACVNCGHSTTDREGICIFERRVRPFSNGFVFCGCKCEFPAAAPLAAKEEED